MKTWIIIGAVNMALAVALGAFGTHALRNSFDAKQLAWWATAQQYHVWHSLGLILVCLLPGNASQLSQRLFAVGIVFFSGSLYAMALTKLTWLGAITPFGGACFILGWIAVAFTAAKKRTIDSC